MLTALHKSRETRLHSLRVSAAARAMASASRLFSGATEPALILQNAAAELAERPGSLCVLSLMSHETQRLWPVAVEYAGRCPAYLLRGLVARTRPLAVDAFSRSAQRGRHAIRVPIAAPQQLRMWFPRPYWRYADRVTVAEVLAAPMVHHEQVVGTILLLRESGQRAYRDTDEHYVAELARRLGLMIGGLGVGSPALS